MRRSLIFLFALFASLITLHGEEAPDVIENLPDSEGTLVVWGRDIVVLRASLGTLTPKFRVKMAHSRLTTLPDEATFAKIKVHSIRAADMEGRSFLLGDFLLFSIADADMAPGSEESLDEAAARVVKNLEALLEAQKTQRHPSVIIRGILFSLLATAVFAGVVWCLLWVRRFLRKILLRKASKVKKLKLRGVDLRVSILRVVRPIINLLVLVVGLVAFAYWVRVVLGQFPYTTAWGGVLKEKLEALAGSFIQGVIGALPGLTVVVVIFFLTRGFGRLLDTVLKSFESDDEGEASWFSGDTARATRRLVVVLVWIAGFVVAFPYIPGSDSAAFRGIGVMAGLMISLGSTGVVNQVMSGLVALYSGAVRTGEYARIGEVEGTITEVGILATKVLTPKQEYITVPNSVLVSDNTLNYSRLKGDERTLVSTSVTIGYDTPWRQVYAMLLLAAGRTRGVRKNPEPSIRQSALTDYYVEYSLRFVPAEVREKNKVLSALHENILDVFNEFGVQITSPNYVADPPELQVIPKEQWTPAPVEPES